MITKYPISMGGDEELPARIAVDYRYSAEGKEKWKRNKEAGASYQENLDWMIRATVSCKTQKDFYRVYRRAVRLEGKGELPRYRSQPPHAPEKHLSAGVAEGDVWWTPQRKSIMFFRPSLAKVEAALGKAGLRLAE